MNPMKLEALRQKLTASRQESALFDLPRFRQNIEAAYLQMWEIWQAGEAPRGFTIAQKKGA
jgi:predicted O-linked N-acetylglucosamine transferase (SPINDLY family)